MLSASCLNCQCLIPFDLLARWWISNRRPTTKARWGIFWPHFWPDGDGRWRKRRFRSRRKARRRGERWNVYAGWPRGDAGPGVFDPHGHGAALYPIQRRRRISCMGAGCPTPRELSPRSARRQRRCERKGIGLGCCLSAARSATRPAPRLANETPKGSRFLINGEPTDNRLALASKGALRAVFRATGKMAHSAYPELGDSAVHKLVRGDGQAAGAGVAGDRKTWVHRH